MTSPRIFRVFRIFTWFILFFILFHYPLITLRCLRNISNLSNGAIPVYYANFIARQTSCDYSSPRYAGSTGSNWNGARGMCVAATIYHEVKYPTSASGAFHPRIALLLSFRFPWRLDSVNRSVRNYLEKETGFDFPRFVIVIVEK